MRLRIVTWNQYNQPGKWSTFNSFSASISLKPHGKHKDKRYKENTLRNLKEKKLNNQQRSVKRSNNRKQNLDFRRNKRNWHHQESKQPSVAAHTQINYNPSGKFHEKVGIFIFLFIRRAPVLGFRRPADLDRGDEWLQSGVRNPKNRTPSDRKQKELRGINRIWFGTALFLGLFF